MTNRGGGRLTIDGFDPDHLIETRTGLGLSRQALARLSGVSMRALGNWEHGRVAPSQEAWEKVRRALIDRVGQLSIGVAP